MNLTETKIDREQLIDGVLLKAYRDRVRLPNGGESVREWIDHPGASAVVPLFEDGTTVLLRQFRYPPRKVFIEVPAGKLDEPGEDPADVAHRELEEEIGWQAEEMIPLGSFYPCIGYSNEVIHLYLARGLTRSMAPSVDEEFLEPFRVSFEEALAMAARGEIEDMKSMVALWRAQSFLEGRANGAAPA